VSYGLQIFNAQGNPIMDTDERFTRVYGSYENRIITGTRYGGNSKYLELRTFSQDVAVALPAGIQQWVPIVVNTSMVNYAGGVRSVGGGFTNNFPNITSDPVVNAVNSGDTNLEGNLMYASGNLIPNIIASAVTIGGNSFARFNWRYCPAVAVSNGTFICYVEKRLTYSFIVVGY
jgi:hypothetical protein